ncbi:MAG: triose-phosphate isomerase [Proteobacteria bacterium]|nr:triose-phosphate isomerase [Pseudomonadota bacterium]
MAKRRPLIAGNWKMFKSCQDAVDTARLLAGLASGADHTDIMIAPSFTSLFPVSQVLKSSAIALGAQNLHWEKEGAFTGEISADMLHSCGCSHVIIGHSERRQFFGECDETVNKRIACAVSNHLVPVFCIGETEIEREQDKTMNILDKQVKDGLKGLGSDELKALVLAYEPVWAIGTGKTATPDQVQDVHLFLRSLIGDVYGIEFAKSIRIIYGGSVKPANISELMMLEDVDGALVGGASLDAETFNKIIRFK